MDLGYTNLNLGSAAWRSVTDGGPPGLAALLGGATINTRGMPAAGVGTAFGVELGGNRGCCQPPPSITERPD